ncbi:uncharacterized protein DNG_04494 [Cephalotrichum gorgonifer]|uniref:Zn(2)-C6 fungal-type domain-containing protein n=1 Tax=Cephalotrichum gorgonifer TaxID=2041049 RepID=A0AAE8MW81_9PEZI|nr:uncharacterized protein DNG_04494 [Cephalotrichum gorgonifer]
METPSPNVSSGLTHEEHDVDSAPPAKRPKLTSAAFTRRKRAVAACQFCRLRKTKCDTVKPVCGFCRNQKAKCVYADEADEADGQAESRHRHEEILARFDELKSLLQTRDSGQPAVSAPAQSPQSHGTPATISDIGTPASLLASRSSASPLWPSYMASSCESLLRWPIFEGIVTDRDARINSFVFGPYNSHECQVSPSPRAPAFGLQNARIGRDALLRPTVQEEALVPLCQKFLAHVHPRNPILEPAELMSYAKSAAENGLGWDAPSCLVLIVCAIACYTQPWSPPTHTKAGLGIPEPEILPSACENTEYGSAAEAYYIAAQKRIGLLETSLIGVQCLFFACIYEKYRLRPVQAWLYLQRASSCLQIRHIGQVTTGLDPTNAPEALRTTHEDLEQRLFWSLFKAESELSPELGLRPSIPVKFDRPDALPSPPASLTLTSEEENGGGAPRRVDVLQRSEEERGWFFYLAEISLRRTIDDMMSLFYRRGEEYWIKHVDIVLRQFQESEKEISNWHSHLPSSIKFEPTNYPPNELAFYLQGRFEDWRECISRPLLYSYLHHPPHLSPSPQVIDVAQQEVALCADIILRSVNHHRHGGTWFVCRAAFRSAVLVLAVIVKGGEVRAPDNWWDLVKFSITTLERWSTEAVDLGRMKDSLEGLLNAVCERTGGRGTS